MRGAAGRRASRWVLGLAIALVAMQPVPAADAHDCPSAPPDAIAPPGAPHHWLPSSEWVTEHWLPYDERDLRRLLRTSRAEMERQLADDRRTMAELARARGWTVRALAARLVARRRGVSSATRERLRRRAVWTLTQGHLGQHMFFHSLHTRSLPEAYRWIFGVRREEDFVRQRDAGLSPLRIGARHGRAASVVRARAIAILRRSARRGVARREVSRRQARLLLSRQRRQLPRWLRSGGRWHRAGDGGGCG